MPSTDKILARFEEISAIPRGTKNEAAIRQWLIEWASSRGSRAKPMRRATLLSMFPQV